MALCPECALNVSTPVHSSHIHAGSVCDMQRAYLKKYAERVPGINFVRL